MRPWFIRPWPRLCLAALRLAIAGSAGSAGLAGLAGLGGLGGMAQASEPPALGRLFNSAPQRAQLDALRLGMAPSAVPAAPAPPRPPPPPPPPLILNGVVRPAHGNTTLWLNHEPLPNAQHMVGPDGQVRLTLPSGRRITLKPGQRYDQTSGEIRDVEP